MPKGKPTSIETKRSIAELVENEVRNHIDYVAERTSKTQEEVLQNYRDIDFSEIRDLPPLTLNCVLGDIYSISKGRIVNYLHNIGDNFREYRGYNIKFQGMRQLNANPEFAKAHAERSRERMRKLRANPKFAKAHVERIRQLNANPEFAKANAERSRERIKKLNANPEFVKANAERNRERMSQLLANPEFAKAHAEKSRERMKKLYANPEFAKAHAERSRERMKKLHANPEFAKAHAERGREIMRKLNANPEFAKAKAKANAEGGKIGAETLRYQRYNFQGNFYDSQSEATTGVLMEKYIPGYKVIEHKTFQMNTEIPKTIDFLVNGTFIEWHPILAFKGKKNLGDITSKEEADSYKRIKNSLAYKEKKEFKREYKQVLAMNYFNSRQEAINQSPTYKGSELILAQTPEELYDSVITRFGTNYPSKDNFKREFNQVVRKVKESKKQKTEAKQEAA